MITIYLRIFPSGKNGRRGSFVSHKLKIDKDIATVKDIFSINKEVFSKGPKCSSGSLDPLKEGYKIARGITFLNLYDKIEDEENLNAIPV